MNKILFIISWSVILTLVLTACGAPAAADPVTVVENYYDALTASDLEKAMSFFADDAVYLDQMARISGKEDIRAWLQGLIDTGQSYEVSDLTNTNGRLEYKIKVSVNDRQVYSGLAVTVVKDGKIIFDGTKALWDAECNRDASLPFCAD